MQRIRQGTYFLSLWLVFIAASPHVKHAKKAQSHASPAKKSPATKAADVEEIEVLDAETPTQEDATSEGDDTPTTLFGVMGRLHPALVHLPIAWTLLLCLVELIALARPQEGWRSAGLYLSILTWLSFLPAALTGLLRLEQLPQDPEALAPALLHRNIMYIAAGLASTVALLRVLAKNRLTGPRRLVYLALVCLTFALVGLGAHLGGKLVYGDDYLPF